jgi:hypothetical protein
MDDGTADRRPQTELRDAPALREEWVFAVRGVCSSHPTDGALARAPGALLLNL